jgi:hypothetical protein
MVHLTKRQNIYVIGVIERHQTLSSSDVSNRDAFVGRYLLYVCTTIAFLGGSSKTLLPSKVYVT